jgi:actin-related protein
VFSSYQPVHSDALTNFVLLTGGNTKIFNMDKRIEREITMMRPQGSNINVVKAFDPELDAWNGGVMFARRNDFIEETSISKQQYEE